MQFFGKSDTGMKRRENQDSFITEQLYDNAIICLVCDGMGGANGGSVASETACREFVKQLKKKISDILQQNRNDSEKVCRDTEKILRKAVSSANAAVFKKASREEELEGMGTTLVSALLIDKKLYITNTGDSRLYFGDAGGLTQITRDHSYVQTLVDMGQLTPEEAENNPHKNIITKAIGTQKKIEPDVFYADLEESGTEYILMCSDGLTNFVDKAEIHSIIKEGEDLEAVCTALINRANENGGGDNITVVIIKLDSEPSDKENTDEGAEG